MFSVRIPSSLCPGRQVFRTGQVTQDLWGRRLRPRVYVLWISQLGSWVSFCCHEQVPGTICPYPWIPSLSSSWEGSVQGNLCLVKSQEEHAIPSWGGCWNKLTPPKGLQSVQTPCFCSSGSLKCESTVSRGHVYPKSCLGESFHAQVLGMTLSPWLSLVCCCMVRNLPDKSQDTIWLLQRWEFHVGERCGEEKGQWTLEVRVPTPCTVK